MASQAAASPLPFTAPEGRGQERRAGLEARRARRQARPGVALALGYATVLALARLIDVSEDGKFMLVFGTTYSLVVAFSAVLRPRWYLPLVVAYLPFSRVYPLPFAGLPGANLTNLMLLLGIVAWLSDRAQARRRLRLRGTERLVLLFVALASLSLGGSTASGLDAGEVLQLYRGWLAPILFFFLARGLVRDREDVNAALQVLAWAALLVALDTWKEGIDRGPRGSIDRARVPGLMEQPNQMGAFLVYYGVAHLAFATTARPRRRALLHLAAFAVTARAVLFTFSRAAYMAMAGGAAVVLLFSNPLLLVAAGGGAAASTALFPSLIPDSVRQRLDDTATERSVFSGDGAAPALDKSSAHRLVLWQGAVRMIAAHPFVGVGLGSFQRHIEHYTPVPIKKHDPHDAHNAFLLQAGEMGLPSLLVLLLLFAVWARKALRIRLTHAHPIDRRLALTFLGMLAGVLVSCMLGSRFSEEALIGWFWMVAAMVTVVARLPGDRRRVRRRPRLLALTGPRPA